MRGFVTPKRQGLVCQTEMPRIRSRHTPRKWHSLSHEARGGSRPRDTGPAWQGTYVECLKPGEFLRDWLVTADGPRARGCFKLN